MLRTTNTAPETAAGVTGKRPTRYALFYQDSGGRYKHWVLSTPKEAKFAVREIESEGATLLSIEAFNVFKGRAWVATQEVLNTQ